MVLFDRPVDKIVTEGMNEKARAAARHAYLLCCSQPKLLLGMIWGRGAARSLRGLEKYR